MIGFDSKAWDALMRITAGAIIVVVPLVIWKAIEIAIWFFSNIGFTWGKG